jgi:exodeoxyribonuclease VII small subunit
MSKKSQPDNEKTLTYESAILRIEEIAAILEKGEASVDESLKLFEESVSLIAFCNEKLSVTEQKIVKITEDM